MVLLPKRNGNCDGTEGLPNPTVVIILQCVNVFHQYVVHLKPTERYVSYHNKAEGGKEGHPQTQSYQAISRALRICTVKSRQMPEGKGMDKSEVWLDKLKKE